LTGNTVSENSLGIYLLARFTTLKPNLSDNHVAGNRSKGIAVRSRDGVIGGQFKDNVVMGNDYGIDLNSDNVDNVKVQGNRVVNNSNNGIWIDQGSKNQVKNNVVSDNGNDGIRLEGPGQGNKIQGNQVIGNQDNGIQVNSNSTNAQIKGNEARGNDNYDLDDESGGCGSNTWKSNTFVTRSQDCIE
jgi:parallel beta-helix repeat protein